MGTHPIFESDFDCLTVKRNECRADRGDLYDGSEDDLLSGAAGQFQRRLAIKKPHTGSACRRRLLLHWQRGRSYEPVYDEDNKRLGGGGRSNGRGEQAKDEKRVFIAKMGA